MGLSIQRRGVPLKLSFAFVFALLVSVSRVSGSTDHQLAPFNDESKGSSNSVSPLSSSSSTADAASLTDDFSSSYDFSDLDKATAAEAIPPPVPLPEGELLPEASESSAQQAAKFTGLLSRLRGHGLDGDALNITPAEENDSWKDELVQGPDAVQFFSVSDNGQPSQAPMAASGLSSSAKGPAEADGVVTAAVLADLAARYNISDVDGGALLDDSWQLESAPLVPEERTMSFAEMQLEAAQIAAQADRASKQQAGSSATAQQADSVAGARQRPSGSAGQPGSAEAAAAAAASGNTGSAEAVKSAVASAPSSAPMAPATPSPSKSAGLGWRGITGIAIGCFVAVLVGAGVVMMIRARHVEQEVASGYAKAGAAEDLELAGRAAIVHSAMAPSDSSSRHTLADN